MKEARRSLVESSLVRALQIELPNINNKSDWPVDWEHVQCGSANPIARENHGTMWMTCNFAESVFQDLLDFFRMAHEKLQAKVERISDDRVAIKNAAGEVLLKGFMYTGEYEANVGRYAMFEATDEAGCEMIFKISAFCQWGYCAFLFHDTIERQVGQEKILRVTTGFGGDLKQGISTKFDLCICDIVVARCLLAYKDMSKDPSIGPTIEMISVHKEYRGRKFLEELWFWVKRFVKDNFTLESLNNDASARSIQIKATRLTNTEIELDEAGSTVTDKRFFYEWAGFSIRRQIHLFPSTDRFQSAIDAEAVLYIALPSKQDIREKAETRFYEGDSNEFKKWKRVKGSRHCWACLSIRIGLLRCSRCRLAQYCSTACQKKHFKYHKHWCGKTREQVEEDLTQIADNALSSC
ncbi:unnamed protein product [Cylindrotheca closterium]|uniref:MYND-type domain-containing protein n=1 Tax=Cylindrotheca closterium TaxID=2856 RepID=A0AAD2FYS6_9STRA|nr:unnamed protein product [Cylindrotheca closterium]